MSDRTPTPPSAEAAEPAIAVAQYGTADMQHGDVLFDHKTIKSAAHTPLPGESEPVWVEVTGPEYGQHGLVGWTIQRSPLTTQLRIAGTFRSQKDTHNLSYAQCRVRERLAQPGWHFEMVLPRRMRSHAHSGGMPSSREALSSFVRNLIFSPGAGFLRCLPFYPDSWERSYRTFVPEFAAPPEQVFVICLGHAFRNIALAGNAPSQK